MEHSEPFMSRAIPSQSQRETRELKAVSDIAWAVSRSLDLQSTLEVGIRETLKTVGAEAGCVVLLQGKPPRWMIAAYRSVDQELLRRLEEAVRGDESWPAAQGAALDVLALQSLSDGIKEAMREAGFHSFTVLPLLSSMGVFGMVLAASREERLLGLQSIEVLMTVAEQLATAIENARLHQEVQQELAERKLAEEALREANARLNRLIEAIPDVTYFKDAQGRNLVVNKAFEELVGLGKETILGKTDEEIFPPRLAEQCRTSDEWAVKGREPIRIEEQMIDDKGNKIFFDTIKLPLLDDRGNITGLVGVSRDITERKRAEEEIKRRTEELAALNAIAATVASSLNLQEILDRALDKVLEISGVEVGTMYLLDQQAQELVLATYRGLPEEFADEVRTLKVGESLTGRAAQSGEPIVVDDLTTDPRVTTTLTSEEEIRSFAAIPMKSKEKVQGVMHVASHKYHPFSPEEVRLYTAIANQIGVAIQNARLWRETKRRLRESTVLLEIGRALAGVLALEELLQMIVDSAVETIEPAESGVIHLLDDATGELHPRALAGKAPGVIGEERMRIGKGIAGLALEQGKVINVPEVDADPHFITLEGTHEFKSLLVARLLAEGKRIGTISINSRQIGAFTREDERLLMTLASQAAIAVKNAQLFARSEELAMARERGRIAREIHDSLAQNLASLLMQIDFCLGLIDSDPQATKAILAKAKAFVRENIREIRRSIFALRPLDVEKLGFLPALHKYAQGFEEQNELPVHLSIAGEEVQSQVRPNHEYALFGIIQEALNNVRKHAMANNVWILLDLSAPDVVSLTVRDDGVGFDRKAVEWMASLTCHDSYGLTSMKERAKRLGGKLTVEASPGLGTKITAILPLGNRG